MHRRIASVKISQTIYNFCLKCLNLDMRTVPEIVTSIVRRSPYLEDSLASGILNHSALARLIRKDVEREAMKRVQTGAVIVAIHRLSRLLEGRARRRRNVFRKAPDLIVRLQLFEVTYGNSRPLVQKQIRLFERMRSRPHCFLTVTRGINETTIIASRELRDAVLSLCRDESLVSRIDHLASVTVMLPPGTTQIPGIYSYLLKALAWEGINVVEVVSTLNEFTIVLEEGMIDDAFSIIKRLF